MLRCGRARDAVVDRGTASRAEYAESPHTRAVEHAVVRLRRKIEDDPHDPQFIRTVHGGGGYTLTTERASLEDPAR